MDNAEEYVLQVFRRAQSALERDVNPVHGAYLLKLGEKFAQTTDLKSEIACLNYIRGFAKAGLTFEWLLGRSLRDREFNRDRFDADVRLVYEVLIEAFNGDWYDPFVWNETPQDHSALEPAITFSEPNWNSAAAPAAETMMCAAAPPVYDTPSFIDLLDHPMFIMVRRLTDSAAAFDRISMAERAPSLAVLKMTAKSVVDMARPQNIVVVSETFSEIARLLDSIERKGMVNDAECAAIISGLGTMLSDALHATSSGIRYLQEITEFIHISKETRLK